MTNCTVCNYVYADTRTHCPVCGTYHSENKNAESNRLIVRAQGCEVARGSFYAGKTPKQVKE